MGMSIDTIIKDCEQSIKQTELFIKVHQANMEVGEIKEYRYYIERDKLTMDILRKYQKIEDDNKQLKASITMMHADYNARLKADMVAMLTDLQLEIEELRLDRPLMSRGHECYGFEDKTPTEIKEECSEIIQQKIDKLEDE